MAKIIPDDQPTPNGGVRSEAIFHDGKGNLLDEEDATHVNILEYDAAGNVIHTTYGLVDDE